MIAVVNYGMGNLHSVRNALEAIGEQVELAESAETLERADRIVLPGVGAFGEGMARLRSTGLIPALEAQVLGSCKPMLGICLGLQLLATHGTEGGGCAGLGWIPGRVELLSPVEKTLKIPHVGWNEVKRREDAPLFAGLRSGQDFYFTHSYRLIPDDDGVVEATADYGGCFVAAVRFRSVTAVQFHPEKSQNAGLKLLRNFASWTPAGLHA